MMPNVNGTKLFSQDVMGGGGAGRTPFIFYLTSIFFSLSHQLRRALAGPRHVFVKGNDLKNIDIIVIV